ACDAGRGKRLLQAALDNGRGGVSIEKAAAVISEADGVTAAGIFRGLDPAARLAVVEGMDDVKKAGIMINRLAEADFSQAESLIKGLDDELLFAVGKGLLSDTSEIAAFIWSLKEAGELEPAIEIFTALPEVSQENVLGYLPPEREGAFLAAIYQSPEWKPVLQDICANDEQGYYEVAILVACGYEDIAIDIWNGLPAELQSKVVESIGYDAREGHTQNMDEKEREVLLGRYAGFLDALDTEAVETAFIRMEDEYPMGGLLNVLSGYSKREGIKDQVIVRAADLMGQFLKEDSSVRFEGLLWSLNSDIAVEALARLNEKDLMAVGATDSGIADSTLNAYFEKFSSEALGLSGEEAHDLTAFGTNGITAGKKLTEAASVLLESYPSEATAFFAYMVNPERGMELLRGCSPLDVERLFSAFDDTTLAGYLKLMLPDDVNHRNNKVDGDELLQSQKVVLIADSGAEGHFMQGYISRNENHVPEAVIVPVDGGWECYAIDYTVLGVEPWGKYMPDKGGIDNGVNKNIPIDLLYWDDGKLNAVEDSLRREYDSYKKAYAEFSSSRGRFYPGDFTTLWAFRLGNGSNYGVNGNLRPLAVLIYPEYDHNGAFEKDEGLSRALLDRGYRVMYYRAASDTEVIQDIKSATASQQASFIYFGGHGNPESVCFGDGHSYDETHLDMGDSAELKSITGALINGGTILLGGCGNGVVKKAADGSVIRNIADVVAEAFPQAKYVLASSVLSTDFYGGLYFDYNNMVYDGEFREIQGNRDVGKAVTYDAAAVSYDGKLPAELAEFIDGTRGVRTTGKTALPTAEQQEVISLTAQNIVAPAYAELIGKEFDLDLSRVQIVTGTPLEDFTACVYDGYLWINNAVFDEPGKLATILFHEQAETDLLSGIAAPTDEQVQTAHLQAEEATAAFDNYQENTSNTAAVPCGVEAAYAYLQGQGEDVSLGEVKSLFEAKEYVDGSGSSSLK
ncbi:MAG: hypothetical protein WBE75_00450, partial [Candidatus Omnitrophota bacterium]